MHAFIVEPNPSGHRLFYVAELAKAWEGGRIVWVTSAEAVDSPEAIVHLRELLDRGFLHVEIVLDWTDRAKVLRTFDAGLVVIPDGDRWLTNLIRLMLSPKMRMPDFRVLVMRPPTRSNDRPLLAKFRNLGKRWVGRALLVLSHLRCRSLRLYALTDAFGVGADRIASGFIPLRDPVPSRAIPESREARESLGLANDRLVVGLVGGIDERKNPHIVATGCAQGFDVIPGQLLIVGRMQDSVRQQLEGLRLPPETRVIDDYVSEQFLAEVVSACDALILLYTNHQSASGVLALAAQAGTAVIVPTGTHLAHVAVSHGFGVPSEISPEGLTNALWVVDKNREILSAHAARAAACLGVSEFTSRMLEHPATPVGRRFYAAR